MNAHFQGATRAERLEHLERCAVCRAEWLAEDPSRVFGLLARAPVPQAALDRLSARIGVELDRLESRAVAPRWFGVASIAASLLLAAVFGAVLWSHEVPAERLTRLDAIRPLEALDDGVAGMRVLTSPGADAQVLDLSIGETQVLMIFDESIDL